MSRVIGEAIYFDRVIGNQWVNHMSTRQLIATRKRLREAEFFWRMLSTVDLPRVMQTEPEAADFYLNAFISAARAVEWALQKESPDGWDAWIAGWVATHNDQDRAVRKYFVDQRNKIEKEGGPELTLTITPLSFMAFMRQASMQGVNLQIYPGMPGTELPTYTMIEKPLTEHPGQTLSAACLPFLELTRRLVIDYERDHPLAPAATAPPQAKAARRAGAEHATPEKPDNKP